MFAEGFDEKTISLAMDVFIRHAGIFKNEDLEAPTFKMFLRELGRNMVTFENDKNYAKVAQFLDWYCIEDKFLWFNLEMYLMKKEKIFDA